jgi:hypothetical protein
MRETFGEVTSTLTLTVLSGRSFMLAGFRSRLNDPLLVCRLKPSAICFAMEALHRVEWLLAQSSSDRSSPSTNYMTSA